MFDSYVTSKNTKARKWVVVTVSVSVVAHVIAIGILVIKGYWTIGKVSPEVQDDDLAFYASPPPPPPPPPGGAKKKKTVEKKVKKVKVTETVQQKKEDKDKPEKVTESDEPDGVEGGVKGGVAGGVVGGVLGGVEGGVLGGTGTGPPPPPPKQQIVAPNVLKAQRIAGNDQITMPNNEKVNFKRSGKPRAIAVAMVCVSAGGKVTSVSLRKKSGFAGWDRKLRAEIKKWRFRPVKVGGKAVTACSPITFVYTQKG